MHASRVRAPLADVFLDDAETKSEDCQTGAGTMHALNAERRSNPRQMRLHRDGAFRGNGHVSPSVAGNVRYGSLTEYCRIGAEEADSMLVRSTDRPLWAVRY